MSDNRLGISVGVTGVPQSEAELRRLEASAKNLRDALTNLGRSNLAGSSDFAKNLGMQLRTVEAQLKTLQSQFIATYSASDSFNIRAIAAMRGQADAIKGVARELSALDNISRARGGGNIWTSTIHDALASKMNLASVSAREHAARQKELDEAFGATVASSGRAAAGINSYTNSLRAANAEQSIFSRFLRGGRTPVSLIDEGMRDQRGAMVATLGAGLKSADLGGAGLAAGMGGIVALVGTGAIIHAAEQLGKLNEQIKAGAEATGMTVHQYAQIQGALVLVGDKAEAADAMIRHFSTSIEKATANPKSEQAKAFDSAKIFPDELKAKGSDTFAMLQRVSQALKQFEDDGTKAAFLTEVFGRNDVAIVKLMQDFEGLTGRADKYAGTVDRNIDTATKMNDKLNDLSLSWHTLMEDAAAPMNFVVNILINGLDELKAIPQYFQDFGRYMYGLGAPIRRLLGTPDVELEEWKKNTGTDVPSTTLPDVNVEAKKKPHMQLFGTPSGGAGSHPMFKEQEDAIEQLRQKLSELRAEYQLFAEQQDVAADHQKVQLRFQQASRDISPVQRAQQDYQIDQQTGQAKIAALQNLAAQSATLYAQMTADAAKQRDEDQAAIGAVKNKTEAMNILAAAQKEYNKVVGEGTKAQIEFDVQITKIQDQMTRSATAVAEAQKRAVDEVINKWGSAFDQIGDKLEDTIQEAIKSAFIPMKPEYWWSSSTGPGGIPLMHAHRISPVEQQFSSLGFSALGDLGKTLTSSLMSSLTKQISGGATGDMGSFIAKNILGIGTSSGGLFGKGGLLGSGIGAVSDATKEVSQTTLLTTANTFLSTIAVNTGSTAAEVAAISGTSGAGAATGAVSAAGSAGGFLSGIPVIGGLLSGLFGGGSPASTVLSTAPIGMIFSSGGIVPAAAGMLTPRTFGSDSVLSALTPGERVLNPNDTAKLDRFLNAGPQQSSGDMHLHFHGPADAPSIQRWFKNMMSQNPGVVRDFFRQNALTPRSL